MTDLRSPTVTADLGVLFAPRSIAVLGVSRSPGKLGHRLLQNVKEGGFAGPVYPVNPSGERILDYPTVATVEALPAVVDLALVSLPAPAVPGAIRALAAHGARAAVVLSSGFGEVDGGGRSAEAELLAIARAAGLRLVGPNCMGVFSAPAGLNGTYFWDLPRVPGGIGVVSQSGAYGGLIIRHLGSRGLGVARFLSIGNQADVEIAEVIEYLVDDPATTAIACFVEAVRDGGRFVAAATRAVGRKPVVVLKGGRSDAGRRAAGTHTGSLAGADEVFRAACRRARIALAEETEEFLDAIETLVTVGHARPEAPRVAVITVSGGPSVVAADCAERSGLTVPALSDEARAALRALLPPFAAVGNPVDLTPQVEPARVADAVRVVFDQAAISGAVVVDVGLDIPELADAVVDAARATGKPAVAFGADVPRMIERLRAGGVPVLPSPERAVRAWRALRQITPLPTGPTAGVASPPGCGHGRADRDGARLPADVSEAIRAGAGPLPYDLARRALEAYGVRFCREDVVASVGDAVRAAERLGYPVVVKADTTGLVHKTEAGGVRVDVRSAAEVRVACDELRRVAGAERFVVQERVGFGVELLVGARRDPVFGPVVAFGAGGVLTETVRDVAVRLAPVAEGEAGEMLEDGVRARLLAGPRGLPPVDHAAAVDVIEAVGVLIAAHSRIQEIDVNPLIAAGPDVIAVDAAILVG